MLFKKRQIKKWVKSGEIMEEKPNCYLNPAHSFLFSKKETRFYKWLNGCYNFMKTINLKELRKHYLINNDANLVIRENVGFNLDQIMDFAVKFFGKKKIRFKIPKKFNPLIIEAKNSKWFFATTPLFFENYKISDKQFNDFLDQKDGFRFLTGCSCPKIYNTKKEG
jgi:hypothetical protein